MKRNVIAVLIFTIFSLLSGKVMAQNASGPELTLYYFHGHNRCPSCLAIEKEAKTVVTVELKEYFTQKRIAFESLNIELKRNEAIAKKYDIWGSSLILVDAAGKKTDFTDEGFSYARTKPAEFRKLLNAKIKSLLK